jgi:FtsZ-binding cell division protein ZapB
MQMIKENFENQCIQTCVNIRTELERLDKLSRITMEDETIGMIQLKIPYVKEEQYQTRMTEYIDEIAKATDGFEKEEDKLKYLRNNLCWKRLFSVIVSDMNGIRMNLYKRERISGQSRYLPYEEAVGSTGQSQGIYIQFLISIINYISSIHSKNADAGRLKKTIFIDNPFGAAKDVYIWEPIFKLLKTNNVQLIVPARGVTPATTGRFDVNYILGQKLQNGRQQTVVVEYYSNVTGGELEYTNFEYQQTSLF